MYYSLNGCDYGHVTIFKFCHLPCCRTSCRFAFVVSSIVSSVLTQEIGWEECLQNDLHSLCHVGCKTLTQYSVWWKRLISQTLKLLRIQEKQKKLEMWANAQRDGRPAEYMWRPLFNAAVWLTPTTRVPCSNAAKTRNPLKLPGVPQTNERISAASGPKFTIL